MLLQPFRKAAAVLAQQQPCSGIHSLPRLRLTQPLRSQALGGRRHLLPIHSGSNSIQRTVSSISSSVQMRLFNSSSSRHLLQSGSNKLISPTAQPWRAWVQQQLGGSTVRGAASNSGRALLRSAFSTAAAAAPAGTKAAADSMLYGLRLHSSSAPSWGSGVSSWFNNMPAAAAFWDSWTLWVGSQASFVMATLLNSLNLVGNKLPVALGLLLVDWVHNSPLLSGSRADALHAGHLPDKLPEGGFYAATSKAAASSKASSSSKGSLWRSTGGAAATAWRELLAGLSAGARLLWLGCIWLPALLSAPVMLGSPGFRGWWLALMTVSLEASGPAFIKWGQVRLACLLVGWTHAGWIAGVLWTGKLQCRDKELPGSRQFTAVEVSSCCQAVSSMYSGSSAESPGA
jgi:hypothetical protein